MQRVSASVFSTEVLNKNNNIQLTLVTEDSVTESNAFSSSVTKFLTIILI